MQIEISANSRKLQGTSASRRLRTAGKLPGVIYGGDGAVQPIELDHKDLFYKLKMEAFHASILSINVDGKTEQVLLRDVQMHPFKQQVLHVDFQRVSQNQKIHVKVPLHFINAEIAPGVKLAGGMISHVLTEIDVSCLPKDLPEFIAVDLSEMTAGSTLHLSDLRLPERVEIPALLKGDDQPVATLIVQRGKSADETGTESA
jgi:large subunit ribosomal protein L25